MKRGLYYLLIIFTFLSVLSLNSFALTDFSLTNEQSTYTIPWSGKISPKIYITCNNDFFDCICYARSEDSQYNYLGEFSSGGRTSSFTLFTYTVPGCSAGSESHTYSVYCYDSFDSSKVYKSSSFIIEWPSSSQESTYNSAKSIISSASTKLSNADAAISGASSEINYAKNYGSNCVDTTISDSNLKTAKSKREKASDYLKKANNYWAACNYLNSKNYASSALSYADDSLTYANKAKTIIQSLVQEYLREEQYSNTELKNAETSIKNSRSYLDNLESKLKKAESISCIEEIGFANVIALKNEAESLLNSANKELNLGKSNYDSCSFDQSNVNSANAEKYAKSSKTKSNLAYSEIDSILEKVNNLKDLVEDEINKVKNSIDTATNIANTIEKLLETHPEETLGKIAFSTAKAKREQGREKVKAAKSYYETAGIEFQSGDCSKAKNTAKSALQYSKDAEKTLQDAHSWVTLKIQESGDCAKAINRASNDMNKLYFKSEFGRIFIVDSLDYLINLSKNRITLQNIEQLQNQIKKDAINAKIQLDSSKLSLDKGIFKDCISQADTVSRLAIDIRRKSESVMSQISKDVQNLASLLLQEQINQNNQIKELIESKKSIAVTNKDRLTIAENKSKINDQLIQELQSEKEMLLSSPSLDSLMEQSETLVSKLDELDQNSQIIVTEVLPFVNRYLYIGIIMGFVLSLFIFLSIFAFNKYRLKRSNEINDVQKSNKNNKQRKK